MSYIVGEDAGNTKTVAVVVNMEGEIINRGRAGCGGIYGAGSPESALNAVDEAIAEAIQTAGIQAESLRAGGFSMAGADWPEDFELLERAFTQKRYGQRSPW